MAKKLARETDTAAAPDARRAKQQAIDELRAEAQRWIDACDRRRQRAKLARDAYASLRGTLEYRQHVDGASTWAELDPVFRSQAYRIALDMGEPPLDPRVRIERVVADLAAQRGWARTDVALAVRGDASTTADELRDSPEMVRAKEALRRAREERHRLLADIKEALVALDDPSLQPSEAFEKPFLVAAACSAMIASGALDRPPSTDEIRRELERWLGELDDGDEIRANFGAK